MRLKRGVFGYYELPTFAVGCENPYIEEYDEEYNYFLISHNVAVSRWYPEDVLRSLLNNINVEDTDAAIEELKKGLKRGNFEGSEHPMYTEKCHFKCHSSFVKCNLCDTSL